MFGIANMEALLNLLWLAIGVSVFGAFAARVVTMPAGRRRGQLIGTGSLALLCVVVLLFPIISATDDLHSGNISAEDESTTVHRGGVTHVAPVVFATNVALPPRSVNCTKLDVADVVISSTLLDARTNPRSPPFVTA